MPTPSLSRPRLRDLGHLRPILRDGVLGSYLRWALEARDDFEIWAGPVRHVVAVRPESVRRVLGGSPAFERYVTPTANLFGGGLLRLDKEPWRARRQLLAPAFRRDATTELVAIVHAETEALISNWRGHGQAFKPTRELSFLMLRIFGRLLLGFEFDQQRHAGRPLHAALITLSTDSILRHFLPPALVWGFNARAVGAARRLLDGLCAEVLERGGATPFLTIVREAIADGTLDRATAIDELRSFLIAGHETTATALAWIVATLASQPELIPPIRAEAATAVNAQTPEDVAKLEGTLRLVKEVMRLYPPVPLSIYRAVEHTTLGPLQVARGTRVDVCSYLLHRLPWVWDEPERADPDRFLGAVAPLSWIPFLIGPHTCIGARLALLELPLVAARLIDAFEFALPKGPPQLNLRVSLNPAGLLITAKSRS